MLFYEGFILGKNAKSQKFHLIPYGAADLGGSLATHGDLGSKNYHGQKVLRILY
jgi:hypothetical protein